MSELQVAELSKDLQAAIAGLEKAEGLKDAGVVIRVGDGVAWVHGLKQAGYSEVLEIDSKAGVVEAFALNLMEDEIGAVILGDDSKVAAGDTVRLKGTLLEVPVGEELLGRVVDPLGRPLDGGPAIKAKHFNPIELQETFERSAMRKTWLDAFGKLRFWNMYCDLYPELAETEGGRLPVRFGVGTLREAPHLFQTLDRNGSVVVR